MSARPETARLKLGFIALTDCAPLVVAKEHGLFEAEGLDIALSREASWANIRDKVASGALDGAHMLAPIALASTLGAGASAVPMIAPISLNANGSSITLSKTLATQVRTYGGHETPAGSPRAAHALKRLIDRRAAAGERPLTFAVVFPFSIHNYLLRYWLADAGIDPDRDVRLTVVPPPRMAARMLAGEVDGFCVGAPWGAVVEAAGAGDAEHGGQEQGLGEGMNPQLPGQEHAANDDQLADNAGLLRPEAVDKHAVDHAQEGAGQGRGGDHQALLGGVEVKIGPDQDRQRPEQHPDHEADVEIQERGEQGGRMARLQHRLERHANPPKRKTPAGGVIP